MDFRLFGPMWHRLVGYIENNPVEFTSRLSSAFVSVVCPSCTSFAAFQDRIVTALGNNELQVHLKDAFYHHILVPTVAALPEVMVLGIGAALIFEAVASQAAVLPVEGPQLRRWSRILFRSGFVAAMGVLMWWLPKDFEFDAVLRDQGHLLPLAGVFASIALVYFLLFATTYYALVSPNVRVVAAPGLLRYIFRGVARVTT